MRRATWLSLGVATLLAIAAVFLGKTWLDAQNERHATPGMSTIVVAARELNFGDSLGPADIRLVRWPAEAMPSGAFRSVEALQLGHVSRQALGRLAVNEPITSSRVTGPEQRAILSAVVQEGMRAFAIRVDDVVGVGGFVLPNDRVDIILVRADENARGSSSFRSDLLLQNVRVLGIDQDPAASEETARVARAVTLEVTPEQAQILSLAAQSGSIRLALRNQVSDDVNAARTITLNDLRAQGSVTEASTVRPRAPRPRTAQAPSGPSVVVVRGDQRAVVQVRPE